MDVRDLFLEQHAAMQSAAVGGNKMSAAERTFAGLTDEQWKSASLCPDWNVRRVVGHMTATARLTPAAFLGAFAGSGFSFNKFANKQIDKNIGPGNVATLAHFRAVQDLTTSPPGPKQSWLGEVIVHSEDIRRPLGIVHTYDPDAVVEVAEFYKGSNALIGTKRRIDGVPAFAQRTQLLDRARIQERMIRHQIDALALSAFAQVERGFVAFRQRLLNQDVFSSFDRPLRELVVRARRRGDCDGVDLAVF